ncbi:MAG: ATP synthase F0 subunit C [bacterium]
MNTITIILVIFIGTLGPCLIIAHVGYGAVHALSRNPLSAPKIFLSMIITFLFAESIAVIALLVLFNIFK